jgi:hypothetical protein
VTDDEDVPESGRGRSAYGPRALKMTGELADGWVPSFRGEVAPLVEMAGRLDAAIADAGRERKDVRRVLNINGTITDRASEGPLHGPVGQWTDELSRLSLEQGFDTFILWTEDDEQLPRFAEEVVPAVREQVSADSRSSPLASRAFSCLDVRK